MVHCGRWKFREIKTLSKMTQLINDTGVLCLYVFCSFAATLPLAFVLGKESKDYRSEGSTLKFYTAI